MKIVVRFASCSSLERRCRGRSVRHRGAGGRPRRSLARRVLLPALSVLAVVGLPLPARGALGIDEIPLAELNPNGGAESMVISNLIANGAFDNDVSGWDLENGATWDAMDSAGDPESGSLRFNGIVDVHQCMQVEPGVYYHLSLEAIRPAPGESGPIRATFIDTTGESCPSETSGGFLGWEQVVGNDWFRMTGPFLMPEGVTHLALELRDGFPGVTHFDDVILGKHAPNASVDMAVSDQTLFPEQEFAIDVTYASQFNGTQPDLRIFHEDRISLVGFDCEVGDVIDVQQGGEHFFRWFNIPGDREPYEYTCTMTARAKSGFAGGFALQAVASCEDCDSDYDPADNEETVPMEVAAAPDVAATLAVSEFPAAGDTAEVVLTLDNFGTGSAGVAGVSVVFSVPMLLQSATGSDPTCGSFTHSDPQAVEGSLFIGAPGSSLACSLVLQIPGDQPQAPLAVSVFTNTVGDTEPDNDSDHAETRVVHLLVNRTIDGFDRALGDGICEGTSGGGDCSLRAAVMEANALQATTGHAYTVEIPHSPFVYQLTRTAGDDAQLYGSLDIFRRMILVGVPDDDGALPLVAASFQSADADRLIRIGSPAGFVRIENLHLRGQGLVPDNGDGLGIDGGLILHESGELQLRNVTLAGGATEGRGGAVHSASDDANGHLTLERVEVFDNEAEQGGGVAFVPEGFAVLTVEESEFHGNDADDVGGGIFAAGIEAGALPFVAILRSTLYDNVAIGGGGAFLDGVTLASVSNSTVSSNVGLLVGGGIAAVQETPLTVYSSTIAFNEAGPGNDDEGLGGGIYLNTDATATLYNSIVSGNTGQAECSQPEPPLPPICVPKAANCYGTLDSAGYNAMGSLLDSACDLESTTGDHGGNVSLASLADNGGPTLTHAPSTIGQIVDAGDPACRTSPGGDPLSIDQRGAARPFDGDDDGTARCDRGAYELSDVARITVTVENDELGRVNSTPAGIACGAGTADQCSAPFAFEVEVVLTATVAPGSGGGFVGWSGACAGQGNPCTVSASGDLQVTARFEQGATTRTLTVEPFGVSGGGEVVSSPAGIDCPDQCEAELPIGAAVTLTATPSPGSVFLGFFGGDCDETPGAPCTVTLDTDLLVGAWFEEEQFASFAPLALEVDAEALLSDGNRVFEPGERVEVAPAWRNNGDASDELTGEASGFTGPGAASYQIVASDADYGLVFPIGEASCRDATGVCYQMDVGPVGVERPALHWDAAFDETLSDVAATAQTWALHLGGSFPDVPRASPFYRFIETLLHNQVTSGCGASAYCPAGANSRAQMTVFVLKALEGPEYQPPACQASTPAFADVPVSSPFCPWIEELARRGVVSGCSDGNYCPGAPVTRAQMAIFLLKTLEGSSYTAPPCLGIFADVSCPSLFADWIEDLFGRGVSGGCSAEPLRYCPSDPVSRAQMAVFLTKTFGLDLYGP